MINIVYIEGVEATVQQFKFKFLTIAILAVMSIGLIGCGNSATTTTPNAPAGNAATVNGKAITMEEVERAVKQQAQGQESKLSPLELAQARLQVVQSLIQQEVMFQKADKESKEIKNADTIQIKTTDDKTEVKTTTSNDKKK